MYQLLELSIGILLLLTRVCAQESVSIQEHLIDQYSTFIQTLQQSLGKVSWIDRNWNLFVVGVVTIGIVVVSTGPFVKNRSKESYIYRIMTGFGEKFNMAISRSSSAFGFGGPSLSSSDPSLRESYQRALSLGGSVGGLANDGNTCFMNSVLQSLASSNEIMDFLGKFTNDENNALSGKYAFSAALHDLLEKLNAKHGNKSPTYKTRNLLKVMKDGPSKHLFLGYNQEDAQEFYQSVMNQVEKEYLGPSQNEKNKGELQDKFVDFKEGMLTGLHNLGDLGTIYLPAKQIDPSYPDSDSKVYPMKLITPVDGLQCERIGCTRCGEMGGIRYSVISGLGLNLSSPTQSTYTLQELLDGWTEQEVIDGVECNRCGLQEINSALNESLKKYKEQGPKMEKLIELTTQRIQEIDVELAKPIINDAVYKKLHTKNRIQKSQKTKQIFFARPPPVLCIHISRSVFDPRTYTVRKNNAKITFPMKLDLTDYVAEPDNINMDARLAFRKCDEGKEITDKKEETEIPEVLEKLEPVPQATDGSNKLEQEKESTPSGLMYSLKSVISHFGTHNYGHYIAYRKYRGVWWRISDEIVRISSEAEVLASQGTYMLFYELSSRNDPRDSIKPDHVEVVAPQDIEEPIQADARTDSENEYESNNSLADELHVNTEDDLRQNEMIAIQANL
ncbi:hypothetical protein OGAPHI_004290 [Ogataea philodendri]|uniref:Ubiquitin carboxyl-terminal hydrolase n=1 Tax=Ogataea philodendri TaxID=1378263 RepID=A0A9P8P6T7_9ASCO|nr:uncharacterized protein OGAPHI_004290 [Ogataea philodendri]KAH3666101.1 hypothetical protein OGAPHI_004290 [Ogataea philodendri]